MSPASSMAIRVSSTSSGLSSTRRMEVVSAAAIPGPLPAAPRALRGDAEGDRGARLTGPVEVEPAPPAVALDEQAREREAHPDARQLAARLQHAAGLEGGLGQVGIDARAVV